MKWLPDVESITRDLIGVGSMNSELACADAIICHLLAPTPDNLIPDWRLFIWDAAYHDTSSVERGGNIACLLEGEHPQKTNDTLILMGHYDTVGIADYGTTFSDAEIAFDPDTLLQAILSKIAADEIPQQGVIDDAQATMTTVSGFQDSAWLFGRGSVDMKSGLAINMVVMRALWQNRAALKGNVLFLASPDEESNSAGILAAVKHLNTLAQENDLNFIGAINTDYTVARDDNRQERYIYTGTIGKLLPSFYILGATTHVGEPFRGVDAAQVAAEIVHEFNLNVDLSDQWTWDNQTEIAVPPIVLKMRDLKASYDVQTTPAAFVYINWLTFAFSPAVVMEKSVMIAKKALQKVDEERHHQFHKYKQADDGEHYPPPHVLKVVTFDELMQRVLTKKGWSSLAKVHDLIRGYIDDITSTMQAERDNHTAADLNQDLWQTLNLAEAYDERELSRLVVEKLAKDAELQAPAVVVYFSPPYYPHIKPQENLLTENLRAVLKDEALQAMMAAVDESGKIVLRGFYPYISDMSFLCLDDDVRGVVDVLTANMPVYQADDYRLPLDDIAALGCPVINIGPYGEAAHGVYERVYKPYSFEVVPQLMYDFVLRLFKGTEKSD